MADVMSNHGGDGGDEPPRRPGKRQRQRCESQPIVELESNNGPTEKQSKKAQTRSNSTGKNLHEIWVTNGKKKLPIEFDVEGGSFAPVNTTQKLYTRAIGNKVREYLIPCHKSWASVPNEERQKVFKKVKKFFNIRGENPLSAHEYKMVKESFQRTAAQCYSRFKTAAKNYYKEQQKVPRNPDFSGNYRKLSNDDWQKCIDLFNTEAYKNRCITNANNRKKQKYPCYQGSKSLIAHTYDWKRDEEKNMVGDEDDDVAETGSLVELFLKMHRKGGEWANDTAAADYVKLLDARENFINRSPDDPVNDRVVLKEALGIRRGHERGYGRILRGSTSFSSCEDHEFSSAASASTHESSATAAAAAAAAAANSALEKKLARMSKVLAQLQAKFGIDDEDEDMDAQSHDDEPENDRS